MMVKQSRVSRNENYVSVLIGSSGIAEVPKLHTATGGRYYES